MSEQTIAAFQDGLRAAALAAMHDLSGGIEGGWETPHDSAGLWMVMIHGGDTERDEDWQEAYREAEAVDAWKRSEDIRQRHM